ncbi:uncharacterized protein LOC112904587 [Agrilus planipennis]|nr:uncharacterized protein LOC112904587 [Agrilus planipennis]
MEPYEQSNIESVENQEETYGSETLDDTAQGVGDDTEDFSLMETGDDEPHPGTSGDGTGDGQDVKFSIETSEKKPKKRMNARMRFVVDGFVYHNNVIAGTPPLRYLGCAEFKRAGCRARASIPVGGTLDQLKVTKPHNHPPDINAEERYEFVKELKSAVRSMQNATLKKVYETIAEIYPSGAEEIPFKSISSSLHRWRCNPHL